MELYKMAPFVAVLAAIASVIFFVMHKTDVGFGLFGAGLIAALLGKE